MPETVTAPPIPKRFTKTRTVRFWGASYSITPLAADGHLGDGRRLLRFAPLNTRPDYYLVRVDSAWDGEAIHDHIDDIIDALIECFSEKERERESLAEELRSQGIEPTAANTDLAGNEDRLGWPALDLDSGYSWGAMAVWDGRRWVPEK